MSPTTSSSGLKINAIGSTSFRDVQHHSRKPRKGEKREVGKFYWNSYWQFVYEVLAINGDAVTIRTPVNGETWSHRTALDTGTDRYVYEYYVKENLSPQGDTLLIIGGSI